MINNSCTVCGNDQTGLHPIVYAYQLNNNDSITIRKCIQCKNFYTFFTQNINLDNYYDQGDYSIRNTHKTLFYYIQKLEYNQVLSLIKRSLNKDQNSLLDFGSGKGLFLHFAQNLGFNVKGIETSLPRAGFASQFYGLDINTSFYADGMVFNQHFDCITCFHVLEHIPHPGNLIKMLLKDNLKQNGLFVIEVPNFNSWQSKWSGKYWLHLDIPRHLTHFTPEQLDLLITASDCSVYKKQYFSWHLGIIGMAQYIFNLFGYKGFLIGDLKEKKNLALLLLLPFILPVACIFEILASSCRRGGIIRVYAIKNS